MYVICVLLLSFVCLFYVDSPGKTTAATLVARSQGFEAVEFNASDVRSKNTLDEVIGELI